MIKPTIMTWAEHVVHARAKRTVYRILVAKPSTINLHKPDAPIRPGINLKNETASELGKRPKISITQIFISLVHVQYSQFYSLNYTLTKYQNLKRSECPFDTKKVMLIYQNGTPLT
jgi:hypothetical protein